MCYLGNEWIPLWFLLFSHVPNMISLGHINLYIFQTVLRLNFTFRKTLRCEDYFPTPLYYWRNVMTNAFLLFCKVHLEIKFMAESVLWTVLGFLLVLIIEVKWKSTCRMNFKQRNINRQSSQQWMNTSAIQCVQCIHFYRKVWSLS